MATGRYTSDLEQGEILGPVEVVISPFMVREYCHATELHQPCFQDDPQPIVPPSMVHLEKLRLYTLYCPEGCGPNARVHYCFDARWHAPVRAGQTLLVQGLVSRRYLKREREYMDMDITLRTKAEGRLLVEYRDTICLSYREAAKDAA
ncbi:hypothetical protein C8P66_101304 [Humitalea rosea]|uniref:MaoC dehydratase-like protein n=1 Tax=Humitalea rosea TaxID=990373 RepID=A0A2W7ITC0_9PROT|nr:hypothetical protein [Humitalea rosea]PZW51086.1 hypothetical protein C8P66_101304 [Humitalea rosea]